MQKITEIIKYAHVMTENSIKCKCGHTINMNPKLDKEICSWCNNYVFRNPKDEFVYRVKEKMIQNRAI
jgi:hypothetical protein